MTHVLLLESDVTLGRAYQQALEHAGYTVTLSRTAQDALGAAEDHLPDIVVLELQLVTHNGVEFLHEFRSYSEWQTVPAVVNTHMRPQAIVDAEKALRQNLGVVEVLYKPRTSLAHLVRVIGSQVRSAG
jgi:DNA-binding response OmpR family regulator